jgi:hypothetical protein
MLRMPDGWLGFMKVQATNQPLPASNKQGGVRAEEK